MIPKALINPTLKHKLLSSHLRDYYNPDYQSSAPSFDNMVDMPFVKY